MCVHGWAGLGGGVLGEEGRGVGGGLRLLLGVGFGGCGCEGWGGGHGSVVDLMRRFDVVFGGGGAGGGFD